MQTPDITESNIEKIGLLFPNCLTERKGEDGKVEQVIDFDQLRQELSKEIVEGPQERYQFTWPDKKKAIRLANAPSTMTLRPCREESVDFDNTENLYIEGDNLEVLKLLREDYHGKVKMIYIDPPYNTGNDFVYEDDFSQTAADYAGNSGQSDDLGNRLVQNTESNGRFHTDWLNMIYPRLRLAKDLLTPDGIIFISIDDNEVDNLRKVCDEIFGADNLINEICINMNSLSGVKMTHVIKGKRFPAQKEYLLIYKKGIQQPVLSIEKKPKGSWDKEYNMIIPELEKGQFEAFSAMDDASMNLILSKMHLVSLAEFSKKEGLAINDDWKFQNSYRIFGTKSNRSLAKKVSNKSSIQQILGYTNTDGNKRFYRTDFNKDTKDPRIELVQAASTLEVFISDNWTDISNDGGVAQEGGVIYPNGKKPLQLLKRIVKTANCEDGIYLDFFAGSSTTAHAIMQQNVLDNGIRRFIMVQYPENLDKTLENVSGDDKDDVLSLISFCDEINKPHLLTEIGKERIRRSGAKILEEQATAESEGGLFAQSESKPKVDVGFRVLKLDSSNMNDVYYRPEEFSEQLIVEDNVKEDRTPEDLLFQVMLECNLPLSAKIQTEKISGKEVFTVNNGYLIACFDENVNEEVITAVAKRKPYYFVMRDSSLSSDNVADNFEQIFQAYSKDTSRKIL